MAIYQKLVPQYDSHTTFSLTDLAEEYVKVINENKLKYHNEQETDVSVKKKL
ncbi:MAG: hypothetical protein RCG15_08640 [Candidatus Rickettsia vulgarisii]